MHARVLALVCALFIVPEIAEAHGSKVCATRLRLRAAPSEHSKIETYLKNGATVTVKRQSGKWSQVTVGTKAGWVSSRYLCSKGGRVGRSGRGWQSPLKRTCVTDTFGYRKWRGRVHKGVDLRARTPTPVFAAKGGTVTKAQWLGGYGWAVFVDHGDGTSSRYAHLCCGRSRPGNKSIAVKRGATVKAGQKLGLTGRTSSAKRNMAPHLHFEIRKGSRAVDPAKLTGLFRLCGAKPVVAQRKRAPIKPLRILRP